MPELQATAYLVPVISDSLSSMRTTNSPLDDTHPVSMHRVIYSSSRPPSTGSQRGMGGSTSLQI